MSSIVSGYEYDIFISYRHNDNLDGWVTHFVESLEKELRGTLKESLTIYFDKNPHDGLLDTHHVDKSLEGKLKCLIFIPILSQTYCDPKSFAWLHEFCAFNKLSQEEELGRDIKLSNGNVASRILPIKIHELDAADTTTIEKEIEGVLRAIEFIYKEPGVNRPLTPHDNKKENLNNTDFRNQTNKVANAAKDLISAIKNPGQTPGSNATQPSAKRTAVKRSYLTVFLVLAALLVGYFLYKNSNSTSTSTVIGNSIAVLPFTDLSPGKDQEYLGDGIAENIIENFSTIKSLKVIGRTSSFSFKGQNVDLKTIGDKLGVENILDGSVSRSDNQIRVRAQLINASDGSQIWTATFDKEMADIFSVQDEISKNVLEKFKISREFYQQEEPPTQSIEAYESYLKGIHLMDRGLTGIQETRDYLKRATELDPNYADAYLELSEAYYRIGVYVFEDQNQSYHLAREYGEKAIQLNPNSPYFLTYYAHLKAIVDLDWDVTLEYLNKARALSEGPVIDIHWAYADLILYGRTERPIQVVEELLKEDPLSVSLLIDLTRLNLAHKHFKEVIKIGSQTLAIHPNNASILRHMASAYYFLGDYDKSLSIYNDLLHLDSSYAPYGNIACLVKMNQKKEAKEFYELLSSKMTSEKKAVSLIQLEKRDSAFYYLNKALDEKTIFIAMSLTEPFWDEIRDDPRFIDLLKRLKLPVKEPLVN